MSVVTNQAFSQFHFSWELMSPTLCAPHVCPWNSCKSTSSVVIERSIVSNSYCGLKKWISMPWATMPRMAPMTTSTLRIIPTTPSVQFKYQFVLHLCGFLICIHMKQGYAKVIGRATPPIRPAKLGKNGKATAIKNARHPKRPLKAIRSHLGQGLFILLVYLNSRSSNTGIA